MTHARYPLKQSLVVALLLLFFHFTTVNAQTETSASIEFLESEHDFGEKLQGSEVKHLFVFKNTGNAPLVIKDVVRSCGCTTPEWTNEPILPGQTGKIYVKYDSNRIGSFQKSITVTSNDPNQPQVNIKIKGIILGPTSGSPLLPENKRIPRSE